MIKNDRILGAPQISYKATLSVLNALTSVEAGAWAYATDVGAHCEYNGASWVFRTGSAGGASLSFQDEGVPLGIPGTVNFVGSPVSVTISGTVARVFVTGSGITDHNLLSGLQGGTGSQYYHLGYNEWGGLVTGSLTRLHKHSAADIVTGTIATARLGTGTADDTTMLMGDQTYKNVRQYFPFGVYVDLSPFSASGKLAYLGAIVASMTLVKWTQGVVVIAPNDGTNYWQITLKRWSDLATVKTIDTSAIAAGTRTQLTTSTFTISSFTTSDVGIYVEITKVGSPGNLFISGPALEYKI